MIKILIVLGAIISTVLTDFAHAEKIAEYDKKILGFVQLGKTTGKQVTSILAKNKCNVKIGKNSYNDTIYITDGHCYKLYGDPIITFVSNAMGTIVEIHIRFYSGRNFENWDYYRMDLLGIYGPKKTVSGGFHFWESGNMNIKLAPKTDPDGNHKSRLVYKYEGSTYITPSSETRNLL